MSSKHELEIELNPTFIAEAQRRYGDLESAIREAIPWVITRIAMAREFDVLEEALDRLDAPAGVFRALIGCELLGVSEARPDVRAWLCDYLSDLDLSEGERYQLAGALSRLGVEARRGHDLPNAISFAQKGLRAIADLPSRAVTANLYYNLGVALEVSGHREAAIDAYEGAASIDEMIGRDEEAAQSRQRLQSLRDQ